MNCKDGYPLGGTLGLELHFGSEAKAAPPKMDHPLTGNRNGTVPLTARPFQRRASVDMGKLADYCGPGNGIQLPKSTKTQRRRRGSLHDNHSADLIAQGQAKVELMYCPELKEGGRNLGPAVGFETMMTRSERLDVERHKKGKLKKLTKRDYKLAVKSWARYDVDGKGKLDMHDWVSAVSRITPSLSAQASSMFNSLDVDHDGVLIFSEFFKVSLPSFRPVNFDVE